MPRENLFLMILAIFEAIADGLCARLRVVSLAVIDSVQIAWDTAFPPLRLRTPFAAMVAAERIMQARQRSRVMAFLDRRLQRDPVALGAGCGLRLAV